MAAELKPDGAPVASVAQPLVSPPNEADLFDYAKLKDYSRYLLGSISRHRYFIGALTVALFALTAALLRGLPKTYHAETQILALKSTLLTKTVDPNVPEDWAEDPTRAAREAILSRANLVALVRQTDLVNKYPRSRAPLLKIEDKIFDWLRPSKPIAEEDQIAAMVGTLESRLEVQVSPGKVTIALDWPDAAMAYELVDAACRNFIEQRRTTDLAPFSDAIDILEPRAAGLREEIVDGVERVDAAREAASLRRRAAAPKRVGLSAAQQLQRQNAERQREELRTALESKKRAIADLVQSQRLQVENLETQIKDARKTYSDEHPAVLELQHGLEVLRAQGDTLELRQLKDEEQQLEAETRRLPATVQQLASATVAEIEDAPIEQAKDDLRFAVSKYLALLDRIDRAQMNLQSARANFKHRFSIVTPAELPRAPIKPKKPMVLLGSIIGGLLLGVFLSALRDLRQGLIFERWQVLRELGIPVLGEIHQ
jgi:uncharacterized protein involved in exopolysaccharide biosynthesis